MPKTIMRSLYCKMKENKFTKFERRFLIAQAILVLGALVYLYLSMSPGIISPISGQTIFDPDFVFEVENGQELLISTSPEFINPIVMTEDSELDLPPGTYYWKVKNWLRESEVNSFTIESNVGLNLRKGNEKDLLENAGNVDVNVAKSKGGITTNIPIEKGKSIEVEKDDSNYQGEQDG